MMRSMGFVVLGLIAIGTGCDPNAKANTNERLASTERLSRTGESCASSLDCAAGLRCIETVCRNTQASPVGEYHAAVGARALAAGETARAIEAYAAAVNRYESDRIAVPVALRCAQGRALMADKQDRTHAEQAARALHSCLLGALAGSKVRAEALKHLAELGADGLDPELLARGQTVDRYLTKEPAGPKTDAIKLSATGDARTRARSYTGFLALMESEGIRNLLLPCWEANWKATKSESLSVTFPFRYRFVEADYEENDRDKLSIEKTETAEGSPERCVYEVLAPAADEYSRSKRTGNRWTAKVTVRLGP